MALGDLRALNAHARFYFEAEARLRYEEYSSDVWFTLQPVYYTSSLAHVRTSRTSSCTGWQIRADGYARIH
jgi:hypothetical protein